MKEHRRSGSRGAWLLAVWLLGASAAPGHDDHDHDPRPPRAEDARVHAPSLLPDRVILTWSDDPATTMSVTWRTSTEIEQGLAEIAPAAPDSKFPERAARIRADRQRLDADLGPAQYHSATFRDLSPSTRYAYRVGDGVNWSEWNQFSTASADPQPFSFVYFGDAQNNIRSMWSRVVREAYRDAPKAAFMIHAGDLINRAESDAEWGEWFMASSHLHRMTPCVPTPGNHEYVALRKIAGIPVSSRLSHHWRALFTLPENGPAGLEETCYWFDFQGVRIVSLNSNVEFFRQAEWLNDVLSRNPQKWTILTFHHPVYSSVAGRDNPLLRATWQPVFDQHRVDLVLQGHDHTYSRSGMMTADNVPTGEGRRDENGTVYVVSVSGPKMYDVQRRPFMHRAAEDTQLYQIIAIDGDELTYEARTAAGELYDRFLIRKRAGEPNRLIDALPDVPERLRPRAEELETK
ncbi:MAG: metallophosphoesterase family protein [Planctomyces sp.]|nr:metallophosphoesterase family protein [Planctomyces sp.]